MSTNTNYMYNIGDMQDSENKLSQYEPRHEKTCFSHMQTTTFVVRYLVQYL